MYYYAQVDVSQGSQVEQYVCNVNFLRYNWHSQAELIVLLKGHISVCTSGTAHELYEDDVLLTHPNCGHSVVSREKASYALSLHFAPELFAEAAPEFRNLHIECISDEQTRSQIKFSHVRQYSAQMMLASLANVAGNRLFFRGAFYQLLGTLLTEFAPGHTVNFETPSDRKNKKIIRTVVEYLEKNFDKKISLEEVAAVAKYNRSYFSTFFKKNVGIGLFDYLTRLRFRHALYLLNNTDKSLTEIAADSGFPDLKTFSVYYKKNFRSLPSQHRSTPDTHAFTATEEGGRIYIEAGDPMIDAKLREYAETDGRGRRD